MIKPRIPGAAFQAAAAPAPPLRNAPPVSAAIAVDAADLSAPLRERLAVVSSQLAPLLKEQARLTAAIKALTEDS